VVDLADDLRETAAIAELRVDEGYQRIKIKISPGHDVDVIGAVRSAVGDDVDLWVDANGSYASDDPVLAELDELHLGLIEQPLDPDAWLDHGVLALRFGTAICLDESIKSLADLRLAQHFGAADGVNVKPSRVGGVRAARQMVDACQAAHIGAWIGGMLDLGINRAVNLALAALDGCDLPGDISATDRYFDRDITAPFELDYDGTIAVPSGPGIGVDVDVEAVASFAVAQITLR